ncbi:MAG TPA: tRNA dihydrouridine synthase DusB [Nitrospiraceae bacterium]|nr:tRNA dihydrouridine synthase DusB [Nitrospiraceae bacterium]
MIKSNPLVLAPMAGITDLPFRIICRELGAGLVYSEMVSAEALIRNQGKTFTLLRSDPAEKPVAFQIFGSRPASMAAAARILSQRPLDCIDINMGCPVPKVLKSGSGSALLRDLTLAREIMDAVVGASAVPVTVKIRLGWDANSIIALDLAQAAEAAGVAAVTIHARTRSQGFSGSADWSMIKAVKDAVGIPVIGNGDVRSGPDAGKMRDETGCDGIMIGRACQGNPWIFREAKQFLETGTPPAPPTPQEKEETIHRHLEEIVALRGEHVGVREMRKHLCWYSKGLPGGAEFRTRVNQLTKVDEVKEEVTAFFADPVMLKR